MFDFPFPPSSFSLLCHKHYIFFSSFPSPIKDSYRAQY